MKIYKCLVEAIDYGKKPNAMQELRAILESFDTIKIIEEFYEEGTIEEGAGAGIFVEISEEDYHNTDKKLREITAKKYGVNEMYYRLGLAITNTKV
jgi:hypothetical protein